MGPLTVTLEWALLYCVGLSLLAALINSTLSKDVPRPAWYDVAVFLTFSLGLGLIIWQGVRGRLPGTGTGTSGPSFLPFVARLLAWSGGLGIAAGAAGALLGHLLVRGSWANQPQGMGIIVVIPGCVGCLVGLLAGAVVAVMKTFY